MTETRAGAGPRKVDEVHAMKAENAAGGCRARGRGPRNGRKCALPRRRGGETTGASLPRASGAGRLCCLRWCFESVQTFQGMPFAVQAPGPVVGSVVAFGGRLAAGTNPRRSGNRRRRTNRLDGRPEATQISRRYPPWTRWSRQSRHFDAELRLDPDGFAPVAGLPGLRPSGHSRRPTAWPLKRIDPPYVHVPFLFVKRFFRPLHHGGTEPGSQRSRSQRRAAAASLPA